MIIISCNHACVYEDEGICTLTHVTSVSELTNKSCAYYRERSVNKQKPNKT
ncbi:MAG: hypothetical protein JJT76_08835 [Clostridiaceae bacterium]|nr:hypothetical protein [Clostridiaceae bacterium]